MFTGTLDTLVNSAISKAKFFKDSKGRYLLASAWAGLYVGLGILLIMVIGSFGTAAGSPYTKMLMGVSFGIALSLVIMAGSELFTGNNMIMMAGALDKKVSWGNSFGIWGLSYIGNFIGSFVIGALFVMTGISKTGVGDFVLKVAATKMNGDFLELLANGIICNILVCVAVLCAIKMKTEAGKLIMIFWCLFAFITIGAEHSIANMSIFSMALLIPHASDVSVAGMFANLLPVTIGNFIGGGILLGAGYYYLGNKRNKLQ